MKRPSLQFYWGDPLRHAGLRTCSLAARGLFLDAFCHMAGSDEHGVLSINGHALSDEKFARLVGEPAKVVAKLLEELLAAGVFARRADGVLFSPRMMRDERVRNKRAEGGKQSLLNPNVPRPLVDPSEESRKDILPSILATDNEPSFGVSPAFASASAPASALKKQTALRALDIPIDNVPTDDLGTKIVYDICDDPAVVIGDEADLVDLVKRFCATNHLGYTGEAVHRWIERAKAKRGQNPNHPLDLVKVRRPQTTAASRLSRAVG